MEITQTARVYVQHGDALAFGLCNEFGEVNERIGLFPSYEDLESYCQESGIRCVDLEPAEKDILTVYQYEQQQGIPERKRLTFMQEWGGEDGPPVYSFQAYASERMMAELAQQVRYEAVDEKTKSLLYGWEGRRPYDGHNEWNSHMDKLTQQQIEACRMLYPEGTRIELAHMEEPYNPVPVGMRGTVQSVEDTGNTQVIWDNGRCFPLIPNMDAFRMLRPSELYQEKEKQRAWLEEANRNLLPFQFECIDGLYRLSLPPISPTEEETDHEIRNIWTQIFTEYFSHNPGLPQIRPEPEREPHCLTSKNPHLLESMGYAFKKLWEDFDGFREVADRVQSRIQAEMDMCF